VRGVSDPAAPAAPRAAGARALHARVASVRSAAADPETLRSVGLAGAMVVTNVVALALTVVFGRILGTDGYGAVAALIAAFLIVAVPGNALQLATARAGSLGELGHGAELHATLDRWARRLLVLAVLAALGGALARRPLAAVVGIDEEWGAAAIPATAVLWVLLCVQRGAFQALGAYKVVGVSMVVEQIARLAFGAGLALGGLDATGAFLGTPLAIAAIALGLGLRLRRRLAPTGRVHGGHRLRRHLRASTAPILGLFVVIGLQNLDVIVANHRLDDDAAGAYSGAAVAAKVTIWVAVGIAFGIVPEATRRAAAGADPRGVLARGLLVLAAAALPALVIFAAVPHLLLKTALGPKFAPGGDVVLLLGVAFTLLAALYLVVQYLLALRRWRFLIPLALLALLEPLILLLPPATRTGLATSVLAVQCAAALLGGVALLCHRPTT